MTQFAHPRIEYPGGTPSYLDLAAWASGLCSQLLTEACLRRCTRGDSPLNRLPGRDYYPVNEPQKPERS